MKEFQKSEKKDMYHSLETQEGPENLKNRVAAVDTSSITQCLKDYYDAMKSIVKVKKHVYEIWSKFTVMSDAEWRRCKRKDKTLSQLSTYHH